MSQPTSKTAIVARYLKSRYRQRVSALELLRIGGALAWRTEVSRCRTQFGMVIRNEQIRTKRGVRSVYIYTGRA